MTRISLCLCALALAGCSAVGPTQEQLKAMEGTSASLCIKSPGWNGAAVEVHYASFGGKGTGTAGGGGTAECGTSKITFVNEGKLVQQPPSGTVWDPATGKATAK